MNVDEILANADVAVDENGNPVVELAECGCCGRTWNNAAVSSITPPPAARCPWELDDEHPCGADDDEDDEDLEEDGAVIETPVPMTLRFEKGERVRHVETGWFGEVLSVSTFEDGDPAYRVRWDVGDRPTYTYRDYMLDREYLDGTNP